MRNTERFKNRNEKTQGVGHLRIREGGLGFCEQISREGENGKLNGPLGLYTALLPNFIEKLFHRGLTRDSHSVHPNGLTQGTYDGMSNLPAQQKYYAAVVAFEE
jgi:hypothetical protein